MSTLCSASKRTPITQDVICQGKKQKFKCTRGTRGGVREREPAYSFTVRPMTDTNHPMSVFVTDRCQSSAALLHPFRCFTLFMPLRQWNCRVICSNSGLRRGLQLLGSSALPRPWVRITDVGVFPRILHQKLALCDSPCSHCEDQLFSRSE